MGSVAVTVRCTTAIPAMQLAAWLLSGLRKQRTLGHSSVILLPESLQSREACFALYLSLTLPRPNDPFSLLARSAQGSTHSTHPLPPSPSHPLTSHPRPYPPALPTHNGPTPSPPPRPIPLSLPLPALQPTHVCRSRRARTTRLRATTSTTASSRGSSFPYTFAVVSTSTTPGIQPVTPPSGHDEHAPPGARRPVHAPRHGGHGTGNGRSLSGSRRTAYPANGPDANEPYANGPDADGPDGTHGIQPRNADAHGQCPSAHGPIATRPNASVRPSTRHSATVTTTATTTTTTTTTPTTPTTTRADGARTGAVQAGTQGTSRARLVERVQPPRCASARPTRDGRIERCWETRSDRPGTMDRRDRRGRPPRARDEPVPNKTGDSQRHLRARENKGYTSRGAGPLERVWDGRGDARGENRRNGAGERGDGAEIARWGGRCSVIRVAEEFGIQQGFTGLAKRGVEPGRGKASRAGQRMGTLVYNVCISAGYAELEAIRSHELVKRMLRALLALLE